MHWLRQRSKHLLDRPWALVLLIAFATGVVVLMDILPGALAALPPVLVAAAVAARAADAFGWAGRFPLVAGAVHVAALLARWLGAVLVPLLALLGADWYVARAGYRPEPAFGMVVAALLLGFATWVYLQPWWSVPGSRRPRWWAWRVAGLLVGLAIAAGLYQYLSREDPPADAAAVSELELVVVGSGPGFPLVDREGSERGWTIHVYAGRAEGRTIAWRAGAPPATPAHDRILLLDVDTGDAGSPDDDVDRWAAIAREAGRGGATTFALLRSGDTARIERWRRRFRPASETRPGDVVLLTGANASRSMSDLALRLVARSPTADEDLALAAQHRPILLFDRDEETPVPLNADRLIEAGLFRLCQTRQLIVANCTNVDESSDLRNGSNYLEFNTRRLAEHTEDTTIYVHVTTREGRKYLDYWWYLPDNPSNAGGGALCGAGFVVAGYTCHDHQSDWEGVTVVVDADAEAGSPEAVHYSAHADRTRYSWSALERIWATGFTADVVRGRTSAARPVVFVARGTHASYPDACRTRCTKRFPPRREEPHDGGQPWPGARESECAALCLTALPTFDRGRRPARWNAYNGRWGSARCELIVFCSSSEPPRSPGNQARYKRPWCAARSVVPAGSGNGVTLDAAFRPPAGCP